jgi:protoheme IX farnesyltransferase
MKTPSDLPELAAELAIETDSASRWRDFYELTKPRLNFLVIVTTLVGFYMAAHGDIPWMLMLHAIGGTTLTAAASAIFNQYLEREFDGQMRRTRNRPLPSGKVSPGEALVFGSITLIAGLAWLTIFVNPLTAILGALTVGCYLFLYTPMKRFSSLNTVIGAVPGAVPPMMGWTALQGSLSPEAFALFGILFIWQMPHFLAIAVMYKDDYAAGGFKMLPVVDPEMRITGHQMVVYTVTLVPVSLIPAILHMAGAAYFVAAVLLGCAFLSFAVSAAATKTRVDSRKLFFASIIYLPLLLGFLMMDKV